MNRALIITFLATLGATMAAAVAALVAQGPEMRRKEVYTRIDERIAARQYAEAESALRRAYPDAAARPADVWLRLGICRSMQDDLEDADRYFAAGLEAAPDDARLLYNQALLYDRMGDVDRAESALWRVVSEAPHFPEARYHLGRLAEDRGDVETARQLYIEELNLGAASHSAWKRHLLLNRQAGKGRGP